MAKSKGQELLESIQATIESYMVFPNHHYGIVAALWVLNTWFFEVFDAVPYLSITAVAKRCGKSTLLDLLRFLSRNPETGGAGTAAAMYTLMEQYGGRCSLFFDEAERLSSGAASMMRSFMNFGYRKGESIPRVMPDRSVMKFPCYGPKAFALIGDPTDTLRDRSILFVLERRVAPKPYRPTRAEEECKAVVRQIKAYLDSGALATMEVLAPDWLDNRDQEIWEPLWSIVNGLGCDKHTIEAFQAASAFLVAGKSAPIKRYTQLEGLDDVDKGEWGEKAIRDLASVFRDGEVGIFSAVAVERLRAIPTAPWANFRGVGLSEPVLADLVSQFGVRPGRIREVTGKGAAASAQRRGYTRKSVFASVPRSK